MVQSYNILGRYTNQCLCLCSHAWPVEVSHGKIRVRPIDALNVHARIYQQTQGQEQEEHLERWEVGHLHTSEIVADHISRTQYQVSDATEHTPVAQAPDIQIKQDGILERIAAYSGRLSATGAIVTLVVRATSSALVVIL